MATDNIAFSIFITDLLKKEGGYVNNPNDSGGETNYGITAYVARTNGYRGPMKDMPRDFAVGVYKKKYWDVIRGDDLAKISQGVAASAADISVNMGPGVAGEYLQRSLNLFNKRGEYYPDITVDKKIGDATLKALRSYIAMRGNNGELVLCRALNVLKGMKYIQLAEAREKDEDFIYGWLLHRVV